MTKLLTTTGALQRAETTIVLQSFASAVLPIHASFSDTLTTSVPVTDTKLTVFDITEGDNYAVVDMNITQATLKAVKMGTMLVMSNLMIRKSVDGTVAWITANIKRGITQIIFDKLEAVKTETATTLSEAFAKVNHLNGGIIYSPNADELKDYTDLPENWRLVLANVAKPLLVPNNSLAVIISDLELEEASDAIVNMVNPAATTANGLPATSEVSLFQQDLTGLRFSILIDIKAIDTIVQIG